MEVYPDKIDGTPHHAHFSGYTSTHRKIITVIIFYLICLIYLIKNALYMSKIHFHLNVVKCVAIDVANDVLPLWWMAVYPFSINKSKSLLHAEIKWLHGNSLDVFVHY